MEKVGSSKLGSQLLEYMASHPPGQ